MCIAAIGRASRPPIGRVRKKVGMAQITLDMHTLIRFGPKEEERNGEEGKGQGNRKAKGGSRPV